MHPWARLSSTVAVAAWLTLLLLFLLGGNLWPLRAGPPRTLRVLDALLFTACLAMGFLLMPAVPALGGGVILVAWIIVLISSVRRASH